LHFYLCQEPDWQGQAQSLEGQAFAWQGQVDLQPLLPATIPLLTWLQQLRPAESALPISVLPMSVLPVPVSNEETS
jgi:8-oxo-dGTP diphosphatase